MDEFARLQKEGTRPSSAKDLKKSFDRGEACYYCKALIVEIREFRGIVQIKLEGNRGVEFFPPWLPAVRVVKHELTPC